MQLQARISVPGKSSMAHTPTMEIFLQPSYATINSYPSFLSQLLLTTLKQSRDNLSSVPFDLNNAYEVIYGYANRSTTAAHPWNGDDIVLVRSLISIT